MRLRFGEIESTFDYMMATREYLEQHGKPLEFYSDKHGIFRINNGGSTTTGVTQFGRVLVAVPIYSDDIKKRKKADMHIAGPKGIYP